MQNRRLIDRGHQPGRWTWALLFAFASSFTPGCADKEAPKAGTNKAVAIAPSTQATEDQEKVEPAAEPAPNQADAASSKEGPAVADPEEAPVVAPPGTVAFVVLRAADEPKRSERRLTKALGRGLRGKVTPLPSDAEAAAFGLAILANEEAVFPKAWHSYQHVVVIQTTNSVDTSDDKKYPGGSSFLGLFRTPNAKPLYLEQGLHLWPYGYDEALPIINSLMKEANR